MTEIFSTLKLPPPSRPGLQDGLGEPHLGGRRDADGRSGQAGGGLAPVSLGWESSAWLHAWIRPFSTAGIRFRRLFGGMAVPADLLVLWHMQGASLVPWLGAKGLVWG